FCNFGDRADSCKSFKTWFGHGQTMAYFGQTIVEVTLRYSLATWPSFWPNNSVKPGLFSNTSELYSHRSAIMESTFIARRAGRQQASSATPLSNNAMAVKVSGSVGLTPNSSCDRTRVSAKLATKPIPTPTNASVMP